MNYLSPQKSATNIDFFQRILKGKTIKYLWKKRFLYLILLLPVVYYLIFYYYPMYGLVIAFEKYSVFRGILGSKWVGLHNFQLIFGSAAFIHALQNTLIISFYKLIFGFPIPIIVSLLLNEVKFSSFKRSIQSIIYFPYFISWVIVSGIILSFLSVDRGFVNELVTMNGFKAIPFLYDPKYFRAILVISGIWKTAGWGTVIYMAALSGIDVQLYEAAVIDGANRWQQTRNIALPGISGTISIVFILSFSSIMNAGFDQIIVLLNAMVMNVGDIIDTFVYRVGLVSGDYSYASAVGLFKSVIGFTLLTGANMLSKKVRGESVY